MAIMVRNKNAWLGIALVLLSAPGYAADWQFSPTLFLAETYTSNIDLAPDPPLPGQLRGPRDEWITEASVGFGLSGASKRLAADFDYRLQGLFDAEGGSETLNYADIGGRLNLTANSLFVDFSGGINQQIVSPGGRVGVSPISNTGNRSEVRRFRVEPFFTRELGNTSGIRAGLQYGQVDYQRSGLADSSSFGASLSLFGNPPASNLSWRLDAINSTIEYDSVSPVNREVELQRIGGELAYLFSRSASLFVGGGDENNEFRGILGAPKIDGSFWHVGLRGKLDRLTDYQVSVGEQHFGESYGLSIKRTAGWLTTNISYLEETTTAGRQQQDYQALFQFLTDIVGAELPTAGISVYVRKRFSLDATLSLPRSRLRLNAYNEDRTYLTEDPFAAILFPDLDLSNEDGVLGMALSWTWTAAARTEFSVDAGWQKFELRSSQDRPEDLRLQLRIQRNMNNNFFVNGRLWRNVRAAVGPLGYEETAVSVGFGKNF